jgi:hypothetical protein
VANRDTFDRFIFIFIIIFDTCGGLECPH